MAEVRLEPKKDILTQFLTVQSYGGCSAGAGCCKSAIYSSTFLHPGSKWRWWEDLLCSWFTSSLALLIDNLPPNSDTHLCDMAQWLQMAGPKRPPAYRNPALDTVPGLN